MNLESVYSGGPQEQCNAVARDAYKEYMRGELAHGALDYVMQRQLQLLATLHEAGYTAKHPIFGFSIIPNRKEQS